MLPTATRAAVVLACAVMLGACERQEPATPLPDQTDDASRADAPGDPLAAMIADLGEPAKTYSVRGEVERLPEPEVAGTDFVVHHEAIDDFLRQDGKLGMHSMSMPFSLADGAELPEGLKPGDKVLLHCAHWLEPRMRFVTYKVERLPDDTALTFRRAEPPTAGAPAESPD